MRPRNHDDDDTVHGRPPSKFHHISPAAAVTTAENARTDYTIDYYINKLLTVIVMRIVVDNK